MSTLVAKSLKVNMDFTCHAASAQGWQAGGWTRWAGRCAQGRTLLVDVRIAPPRHRSASPPPSAHLDVHLDARPAELLHHRQHPERQVDRVCDAISHQLELAVGWHKAHRSILVELTQLDALMERAVVDFNPRSRAPRLVAAVPSLVVEEELVVQPKLALGHPGEVALDLYVPGHVVAQHSALVRHHQVALLNNIDEELILAVLDPLFPPADGTGCLDGDVLRRCRVLLAHRLLALLRDVHLEQVDRRVLRVAVVEHLIEQLVDQYEVVADGVVVHLWAAVRLDDVHE
mmetsp:Transcript_4182/g.10777  ORF Transcript_4182/g.10777 Transcript_4182/m.10777 type:complete len:288 (+) Transcript_4182:534-1397(+)